MAGEQAGAGWWPALRAGLIGLHLLAIGLQSMPSPGSGLVRSAWKDPTVQGEFLAWTHRLNALGWQIGEPELEEGLWQLASTYEAGRSVVLAPFGPYYRYCGTWQSWRMFVAPHRYPTKLHVEVERDGVFVPVYVERDPTLTWHGAQLDHDRMRSAIFRYGWRHYRGAYQDFGQWVAREVAAEDAGATRVRLKMWKAKTPSAAETRAGVQPKGKFESAITVKVPR